MFNVLLCVQVHSLCSHCTCSILVSWISRTSQGGTSAWELFTWIHGTMECIMSLCKLTKRDYFNHIRYLCLATSLLAAQPHVKFHYLLPSILIISLVTLEFHRGPWVHVKSAQTVYSSQQKGGWFMRHSGMYNYQGMYIKAGWKRVSNYYTAHTNVLLSDSVILCVNTHVVVQPHSKQCG